MEKNGMLFVFVFVFVFSVAIAENKKRTYTQVNIESVKASRLPESDNSADLYLLIAMDVFDNKDKDRITPVLSHITVTEYKEINIISEIEYGASLVAGNWDNHSVYMTIHAFDADFFQDISSLNRTVKKKDIDIAMMGNTVYLLGYNITKKVLTAKSKTGIAYTVGSQVTKSASMFLAFWVLEKAIQEIDSDDRMGYNLIEISPHLYKKGIHYEYVKISNPSSSIELKISIRKNSKSYSEIFDANKN